MKKRSKLFHAPRIADGELCEKYPRNRAFIPGALRGSLDVTILARKRRPRVGDTMTSKGQGDLFKSNCKEGNQK
jgi:hypothetical protein